MLNIYDQKYYILGSLPESVVKVDVLGHKPCEGRLWGGDSVEVDGRELEQLEELCPRTPAPIQADGKPLRWKGKTKEFDWTKPWILIDAEEHEAVQSTQKKAEQPTQLVCLCEISKYKVGDVVDAETDAIATELWKSQARSGEGSLFFREKTLHEDLLKIRDLVTSPAGISTEDFIQMLGLNPRNLLNKDLFTLRKRLQAGIKELKQEPDCEDHYESSVNGRFRLVGPNNLISAGGITRSNS